MCCDGFHTLEDCPHEAASIAHPAWGHIQGDAVLIHRLHQAHAQVLVPIEWSDSSESNRPDGRSTKGLVAGMAPLKSLRAEVTLAMPIQGLTRERIRRAETC